MSVTVLLVVRAVDIMRCGRPQTAPVLLRNLAGRAHRILFFPLRVLVRARAAANAGAA